MNDMTEVLTVIFVLWFVVGTIIFIALMKSDIGKCVLRPDWVYEMFPVNIFGCILLTILINLSNPIISIVYWICKFIHFICTVGRDY
jgi:hypothetical protein